MKKKLSAVVALIFVFIFLCAVPASAKTYQTYTYSLGGYALHSPDAYVPENNGCKDSEFMGLTGVAGSLDQPIKLACDLEVDMDGNVYIADAGSETEEDFAGRIIILDKYYKKKAIIRDFTNSHGNPDTLKNPQGVFITKDTIFVCDSGNARIVTFDRNTYEFIDIIPQPESTLFEDNAVYKPVAVAVDEFDRLYVVSSMTYQGIIVMTREGKFISFIGAQTSKLTVWDQIWRRFQTKEQRAASDKNISTEFNNITITKDGFIYVTTNTIDEQLQLDWMTSKDKSGDYHPVKMLNAAGSEIMRRNGFWPPAGEVATRVTNMVNRDESVPVGASSIVDVAVGPEKTWSIIDEKRSKVYTYDYDGNLLFIFGDNKGTQLGNINTLKAVTYQGDNILLLDQKNSTFTVYRRTEYGNKLIKALNNQNERRYNEAVNDWIEILKRNSNYDAAYIGIGQSLYREGTYDSYKESIEYFKAAYDTENYDKSYKEIRKEWISKWIILIPIGVVAICVGCAFFMKYATKVNNKTAVSGTKRSFKEEFLYGFHVIFHPFDGFWDLKHEKRGSVRASIAYIIIAVLAVFYQAIGSGYAINQRTINTSIFEQSLNLLLPVFLWTVANWCLTTLFEGEGSFKDIFIAMGYSLLPLILTTIPTTIASNFVVSDEVMIIEFINTIGLLWVGLLVFVGMMVTHDYSIGKNILTSAGTILGMILIMFISLLFATLIAKIVNFIGNIITEISYRT